MSYARAQYTSRRQRNWGRNQNTTRFVSRVKLGPVMHTVLVAMMLLVLGLVYLTQASGTATYDYQVNKLDEKISSLSAKKSDLEVENARLSALETVKNSDVAKNMTKPKSTEFIK